MSGDLTNDEILILGNLDSDALIVAAGLTERRTEWAWIQSKREYVLIMRETMARIDHEEEDHNGETEGWFRNL